MSKSSQTSLKQQEESRLKKVVRKLQPPIQFLKLRKALIAVIFVNRIKKLQPTSLEYNHDALTIS
jgi:hypothetical protein